MRAIQQHHRIESLTLAMLLLSIDLFSTTSAFAVGSIRMSHGRSLQLQPFSLNGQRSNKNIDDFELFDGFLLWCNVMTFIASTIILPCPSIASIQQTYPVPVESWSGSILLATSGLSSITASPIAELGLKPPSDDKPQITLQGNTPRKISSRQPILQGLVYFPELAPNDTSQVSAEQQFRQQLDYYNDVLILTAVSSSQPNGPVLAGAKLPLSSIRFPLSFQMYEENLLTSRPGVRAAWDSAVNSEDIILRASICPSDTSTSLCGGVERKRYAEGVAKLITKLPGLPEGDCLRAPASLALQ